jgi:hypothetical protein
MGYGKAIVAAAFGLRYSKMRRRRATTFRNGLLEGGDGANA